jgi:hypothetical protein
MTCVGRVSSSEAVLTAVNADPSVPPLSTIFDLCLTSESYCSLSKVRGLEGIRQEEWLRSPANHNEMPVAAPGLDLRGSFS